MAAPIAAQQVLPGAAPNRVEIAVTLDAGAEPGLYNLYLANETGLSAKTLVAVDRLRQQTFDAPIEALPVALHGKLSGSATLRTAFAGKAGQHVVCEVEAQRLGGKLRPVLHLNDSQGQPLAWSLPMTNLHGDARLDVTLPSDGQYTVSLNDLAFAGPDPNHFRLKIGEWQYADLVYPPAVERGKPAMLRLIGNLPQAPASVQSAADAGQLFVPWPNPAQASGPRPAALVSDMPELVESDQRAEPREVAEFPLALNGWIGAPNEVDRYLLKVQPGSKFHLEVFAQRGGSQLDSMLQLLGEKGNVLAENDDFGTSPDSARLYRAPGRQLADARRARPLWQWRRQLCLSHRDRAPGQSGGSAGFSPAGRAGALQHSIRRPAGAQSAAQRAAVSRGRCSWNSIGCGARVQAEGMQIPASASATLVTLSGATTASQWLATLRGSRSIRSSRSRAWRKASRN